MCVNERSVRVSVRVYVCVNERNSVRECVCVCVNVSLSVNLCVC